MALSEMIGEGGLVQADRRELGPVYVSKERRIEGWTRKVFLRRVDRVCLIGSDFRCQPGLQTRRLLRR